MASIIRIKRSSGTSKPSTLQWGEFGYVTGIGSYGGLNQYKDRIFLGDDGTNANPVGGYYYTSMMEHTPGAVAGVQNTRNTDNGVVAVLAPATNTALGGAQSLKVDQWNVDNIRIDGNTISATNTNGDVNITANGTGDINLNDSDVTIDETLTVGGLTDLNGDLDVAGTLNVAGITTLGSNLIVNGTSTLNGDTAIDGDLTVTGDITAFFTSDQRLKDNVTPIEDPLAKILSISGNTYDWNEKSGKEGHDVGVIAQEVLEVLPEAVTTRDNGYLAVDYQKIVPLLVQAVKELSAKVDNLEQNS